MKIIYSILLLSLLGWSLTETQIESPPLEEDSPVLELLEQLGDSPVSHKVDQTVKAVSAEKGKELFHTGFTTNPRGKRTKKQSANFVCTACHNTKREDPDLGVADPEARLEFVVDKGLPFLQGTTMFGAVNRTSFYNGGYDKKYGELVALARNDLREAIQLCATECAQGRRLEPFELESILSYLWTLQYQLKDLELSEKEKNLVQTALSDSSRAREAIQLLKSEYLSGSPATFVDPPEDRTIGNPELTGRPLQGKWIYTASCLHCHEGGKYAFFELDDSKDSFEFLKKHLNRYTRYSLYQVGRYGTQPQPGKATYMPNYTLEKLSRQQMEDLRAYIEQEAQ